MQMDLCCVPMIEQERTSADGVELGWQFAQVSGVESESRLDGSVSTSRASLQPATPDLGEDKAIDRGRDSNFQLCPARDCFFFVKSLCHIT